MDRLNKLENDNALLKTQIRELKNPSESDKIGRTEIIEIIKSIVTISFVNKLYGNKK